MSNDMRQVVAQMLILLGDRMSDAELAEWVTNLRSADHETNCLIVKLVDPANPLTFDRITSTIPLDLLCENIKSPPLDTNKIVDRYFSGDEIDDRYLHGFHDAKYYLTRALQEGNVRVFNEHYYRVDDATLCAIIENWLGSNPNTEERSRMIAEIIRNI